MPSPLKIGLAGLGTVGASVARIVSENITALTQRGGRPLQITAVSARDKNKNRGVDLRHAAWFDTPLELAQKADIDVFVELVGGAEGVAKHAVEAALQRGLPVITANKALLAAHGLKLAQLAEQNNVTLLFEAAVAGGIPVIKTLREAMAGNTIRRVSGILNGTCNYILTRMEREGLSFEACLKEAQRLGYAEADPTFDVGGFDTAHKLALLTSVAFGTQVAADQIYVEGIEHITLADLKAADELGYRIKLLGVAQRTETGIEQRVHPTMIPKNAAIASVDGVLNALQIEGDAVGSIMLVGAGAGGNATASAVLSDIIDCARGTAIKPFALPVANLLPYQAAQLKAHAGGYYIRLSVHDRPGAFAAIAGRMADQGISIESIVQRRRNPREAASDRLTEAPQPVILITHDTTEAAIKKALDAIERDGHITSKPQLIRIESV